MDDYVIIQRKNLAAIGNAMREAYGEDRSYTLEEIIDGIKPLPADTARIQKYLEGAENFRLPIGLPHIRGCSFYNCTNLKEITIPESVGSIGGYAFYDCTSLRTVTFNGKPDSISSKTFYNCTNLKTINVPWSEGEVKNAPWGAKNSTINYNYVNTLSSNIGYSDDILIKKSTLEALTNKLRQSLEIPEQLSVSQISGKMTEIFSKNSTHQYAYMQDKDWTNSLTLEIPYGTTKIRPWAFYESTNSFHPSQKLTVVLPDGLISIGDYAFYYCETLISINLPDGLSNIGTRAFEGCKQLASIIFPDSLRSIGNSAFYLCRELETITFPESLDSIEAYAFKSCPGLTTVTFKGSPTSIGSDAFNSSNLTTINVPWAEGEVAGAPWGATNATINYNYVSAGE